jgi:hypothetical protein
VFLPDQTVVLGQLRGAFALSLFYQKAISQVKKMGRQPCCDKVGLKKGPWTAEEDQKLVSFILSNGQCCWRAVPKLAGASPGLATAL